MENKYGLLIFNSVINFKDDNHFGTQRISRSRLVRVREGHKVYFKKNLTDHFLLLLIVTAVK